MVLCFVLVSNINSVESFTVIGCVLNLTSFSNTYNFFNLLAKFSDYKSTWSPDPIGHNPTHLSNKMWKNHISSRNTTGLPRPPPGLTNPKPSSPWNSTAPRSVRGWGAQDSRLGSGENNQLVALLIRPEHCVFYSTSSLEERKLQLSGNRKKESSFLEWKFAVNNWGGWWVESQVLLQGMSEEGLRAARRE